MYITPANTIKSTASTAHIPYQKCILYTYKQLKLHQVISRNVKISKWECFHFLDNRFKPFFYVQIQFVW